MEHIDCGRFKLVVVVVHGATDAEVPFLFRMFCIGT